MSNTIDNLKDLATKLTGKVILPTDPDYDKARQVFLGK